MKPPEKSRQPPVPPASFKGAEGEPAEDRAEIDLEWRRIEAERLATELAEAREDTAESPALLPGPVGHPFGRWLVPIMAGALLAGRGAADPVTASGSVDLVRYGVPMDSRSLIFVRGASHAFNGLWYVRSVSHALGRGSWRQTFQLSRDGLISQTQRAPT